MKDRRGKSWKPPRTGLTLVEVAAGTAILGSVLVFLLLAQGRLAGQSGRAQRRIEACRVAQELLTDWWPKRSETRCPGEGDVAGRPGWRWRTRSVENADAAALGARVVAIDVLDPGGRTPAATVEILLPPVEKREEATGHDAG